MVDASTGMVGTIAVPDRDRLDEAALARWMTADVEGFDGPLTLAKFAGGQSNPTYRIDSPSASYVLRRKPFGELLPSAHAVDREYAVIAGLHPTGFPVPRAYGLCTDETVIGAMFYVMELVDGRTIWDGGMPGASRGDRRGAYHAMIDTLAALHSVDYAAAGLASFGKPGNYFERQVGRWTKQYRGSQTEVMPAMERLIEFLPRTLPEQTRTSIVHGDYRIDNVIFAPTAPSVLAVLDWELSTLGDPLADVAYLMMNWVTGPEARSGLMGLDLHALGIPTLDQAIARYCAVTRRDSLPDLNWYFAYSLFRLAAIIQGIKKRVIDGTASSADAAETAKRVGPVAEAAWGFAEKAGA